MEIDKRITILNVSQALFSRFGFVKTTVDEIAKLARIGKGTVYHYFKSKEQVFAEVIKRESNTLQEKIQKALRGKQTPQDKLTAFVKTRSRHLKDLTNYYSALTDDYLEHYAFVEETRQKYLEREIQTVKDILEEGVEKGVFDIEDTKITAQAIVLLFKALEYPWSVKKDKFDIELSTNKFLNILFKGIEKRK
ncbi:MAG: TetR/AcrR family transcriptional regulator [Candidatus Aminicenantes bacterium]|nr:TetR/AcrR family transcriptional regulator [Candidatus Aminicenantes bacterium]